MPDTGENHARNCTEANAFRKSRNVPRRQSGLFNVYGKVGHIVTKRRFKCCICEESLSKNEIGLNKKLIGKYVEKIFCLNCLAIHLDTTPEDLLEKIEDFKNEGCTLFE